VKTNNCDVLRLRIATTAAVALAALSAGTAVPAAKLGAPWEQWQHVSRVFDLDGPSSDRRLVTASRDQLTLMGADGAFVRLGDFSLGNDAEAYIAASAGVHPAGTACTFAANETYMLALDKPLGVTRFDPGGHPSRLATVSGVDGLVGIALDRAGGFGNRLLVIGGSKGKTVVTAIDCAGVTRVITDQAPLEEGGLEVAPLSFGRFGGQLIGADENSDSVIAIAPDGTASVVDHPGLAKGGDIGVESVGFVPPGFTAHGGFAYVADRGTPGNPHPGTDSILRLSSTQLANSGVQDGDLLVATEGGGVTVRVRCRATCTSDIVAEGPAPAHIEGHIAFLLDPAGRTARAPAQTSQTPALPGESGGGPWIVVGAMVLLVVAAGAVYILVRRRRRAV
jgi:hypothetical protein